jgi:hypothetical protein
MELFNELKGRRRQDVEDFLTFIPIYESKRRTAALNALLKRHRKYIQGKVVMEAGAGRGIFAQQMAAMGAKEVHAVERSDVLFDLLEANLHHQSTIHCHCEEITEFEPHTQVDLLFHELYGPLVLDETLLALKHLKFQPGSILPDGGRLWAMPISNSQILNTDPQYEPTWAQTLTGALISDLITGIPFRPQWEVFHWDIHSAATAFEFEIPESCDFLALCGEITHQGKSVLKMWWTHNWPVIFTPVAGKRFRLEFQYLGEYTKVHFYWLDKRTLKDGFRHRASK